MYLEANFTCHRGSFAGTVSYVKFVPVLKFPYESWSLYLASFVPTLKLKLKFPSLVVRYLSMGDQHDREQKVAADVRVAWAPDLDVSAVARTATGYDVLVRATSTRGGGGATAAGRGRAVGR